MLARIFHEYSIVGRILLEDPPRQADGSPTPARGARTGLFVGARFIASVLSRDHGEEGRNELHPYEHSGLVEVVGQGVRLRRIPLQQVLVRLGHCSRSIGRFEDIANFLVKHPG